MSKKDESMYKGKNQFTREQATFVVEVILSAALDRVESGMPTWIDWEDRQGQVNEFDKNPKKVTAFERGALEAAGEALALFAAQLTGKGLCIQDALTLAGKFDEKVGDMIKASWDEKGKVVKQRLKSLRGRARKPENVLPDYPDVKKAAEKFVENALDGYLQN